jgi:hypothetical protein
MMIHRARLILAPVILVLLAGLLYAGAPGSSRPFALAARSQSGWDYRYTPTQFLPRHVEIDGVASQIFAAEWAPGDDSAGAPMLPVDLLTLGVPAGAKIDAELRDARYVETSGLPVAPHPSYRLTEEREGMAEYHYDARYYSRNAFLPERTVSIDGPYLLRQANVVTIRIAPLQYNPVTRTLRRLIGGTLHITQSQGDSPRLQRVAASDDPQFEKTYRATIANYDEARAWRYAQQKSLATDSTALWFTPGAKYLRAGVARDGWYRLTHADLAAVGLGSEYFDPTRLKLQLHGRTVPLLISGTDECYFYGRRKQGDSSYYDLYTDTSMYWMTWSASGAGPMYLTGPAISSPEDRTISESRVTLHFEQNTDYYEGTGEAEITTNGPVAGEGWVWEYYYPGTTYSHSFTLDNFQGTTDTTAVLRVSFYSTTLHYNTPDHIARLWVNDSLAGELSFIGRQKGWFEHPIPARWLHEGANTLRITSVTTPSTPNQFYLDWFEIDAPRRNAAAGNQLLVKVDPVPGSPVVSINADGFVSSVLRVLDVTHGRIIQGASIVDGGGGNFSVSFKDTVTSAREYLIVADADALPVASRTSGTFQGIRQSSGGADYIVITHGLFRTVAERIAAHRASHNGVRTAVIDVQRIFDEFNYGQISAECIKDFLRYAYINWPAPAPANVLLFGDASWDFHKYMTTTVMTDFVPSYGVPASDNWYVCFDTTYAWLPTLAIGRLPVQDPEQASRLVDKIIGYDSYTLADWNKNFLFITGGATPGEKITYNTQSDASIQQYVLPPSIGGTPYRVYKSTPNTIDGENIDLLRGIVANGLVFMSFLGHSGGRIWGVDIGRPSDLQNTDGKLPFVSSVSCNVGAFAEPSSNVLSEDFVLADNRAAIGMWASSSLGYATVGQALVNFFLRSVQIDTARAFGELTTTARIQLWQLRGSDRITVASCNLTPLIGDPLSMLALPSKPDLAITSADMSLTIPNPTPHETTTQVSLMLHNYGLVPADSIAIDLTDYYHNSTTDVLRAQRVRPPYHRDTLLVPWKGVADPGAHTLTATLNPQSTMDEVRRDNNAAAFDAYVYVNRLLGIRPLMNQVVPRGPLSLIVGAAAGYDSLASAYLFEVDSTRDFTSSAKRSSGPVTPGLVGAHWETPSLSAGAQYFWRARAMDDTLAGIWLNGAVTVSDSAPAAPIARWHEYSREGFLAATYAKTVATDSGVTLSTTPSIVLGARSLGYRADADRDYYSTLRINKQVITGYWWEQGNSFMALRLDEFTGTFVFKPFNVQSQSVLSDSMVAFIDSSRNGNYLAFTVVYDGYSNVSERLKSALRALGSTKIDSLRPGHAWIFIARKGNGGVGAVERWSPDGVVEDSVTVPSTYSAGSGIVAYRDLPFPQVQGTFAWTTAGDTSRTSIKAFIIGTTPLGRSDTLATIARGSTTTDLSYLTPAIRDSAYAKLGVGASFTTTDPEVTPRLTSWSMDFVPPADLAIGTRSVVFKDGSLAKGTAVGMRVTVFNIGFSAAESALVNVYAIGQGGVRSLACAGSIGRLAVDSAGTITLSVPPELLNDATALEVVVVPPAGQRDMTAENNTVRIPVRYTSVKEPLHATMRLFADGIQLMDGDFVASRPALSIQLADVTGLDSGGAWVVLLVDNVPVSPTYNTASLVGNTAMRKVDENLAFTPDLSEGTHEITMRLYRWSGSAGTDSIDRRMTLQVQNDVRVLRVFNYPNPFQRETEFTFVLTGDHAPDEVRIRIYTIAGRRIREIVVPQYSVQVGFNRVPWDGRDDVGDELANGYYLYQVQVRTAGATSSAIEKLVKVR